MGDGLEGGGLYVYCGSTTGNGSSGRTGIVGNGLYVSCGTGAGTTGGSIGVSRDGSSGSGAVGRGGI